MKKLIICFVIALSAFIPAMADTATETFFPYPAPPDTMAGIQQRTDYFVSHFWDRAPLKSIFSSKARLNDTFEEWIQVLGTATDTVALQAATDFMKRLEKQPNDQAYIVQQAERQLYGDSAQYYSDELYLAFAKPLVENKKVKKELKARPAMLVKVLENSATGKRPPVLKYENRDGSKGDTSQDVAQLVIYYFNDPDCSECQLTRVRLDADIKTTELINSGALKVLSIYPGDADDEWRSKVASYPEAWKVVAAPDADEIFDIRTTPVFYIVYRGKILVKGANITQVLSIINRL